YYHLHRILSSVHTSFSQQDLVPMTGFALPLASTLTNCQGGDGFICFMSYLAMAPKEANSVNEFEGIRAWKAYIGYAKNNWNFRHEDPGVVGTKYYGKTDPRELFSPIVTNHTWQVVSLVSSLEL